MSNRSGHEASSQLMNHAFRKDSFYNHSLNAAAKLDAERDEYRVSSAFLGICALALMAVPQGVFTREGRTTPTGHHDEGLPRTLRRLREFSMEFSERACRVAIGTQTHEDPKCKVLGQMLAFSEYYANKRQRLREEEAAQTALSIAPSSVVTRA